MSEQSPINRIDNVELAYMMAHAAAHRMELAILYKQNAEWAQEDVVYAQEKSIDLYEREELRQYEIQKWTRRVEFWRKHEIREQKAAEYIMEKVQDRHELIESLESENRK